MTTASNPIKPKKSFSGGMPPELLEENLAALGRATLISILCLTMAFFGMIWFPASAPHTTFFGLDLVNLIRFLIIPVGAVVGVILTGGRFLQDVYALEGYWPAISYILSSLFGLWYAHLVIDDGVAKVEENEFNSLLIFGGPGIVLVQPGNAVMFRKLRRRSRHGIISSVFLSRFERVGLIADLEDQEEVIDELRVVTRDGIRVVVTGIKYRYRVLSNQPKTLDNPYPFLDTELDKMAYNMTVREQGQPNWRAFVRQLVSTYVKEFLSDYTIDQLTAPRSDARSPWKEIHVRLTTPSQIPNVRAVGADMLWFDLGHIHILSDVIDDSRVGFWAADWVGNAEAKMAYATGTRMAYQEQARAEAQAELIMSIAHGLEGVNLSKNSAENIRKIFLARTAEVLNSLNSVTQPEAAEDNHDHND
jgi:hypothetical protein